MNEPVLTPPTGTNGGRLRRVLAPLVWIALGAVIAISVARVTGLLSRPTEEPAMSGTPHHHDEAAPAAQKQLWTCGMHPEVIMEEPGQCPICGMDLVPVETGGDAPSHDDMSSMSGSGEREILFYRNPMTPTITSPTPMKDEMGMDYVPVYSDEVDQAASGGATVTIDPGIVQNMNVVTEPVKRRDIHAQIRTVGYLEYDQEKMVSVTTKYSGWIEKVYVNYIGQPVRKGQPLFDIYSPELVQTQQELLSAISFAKEMESAPEDARRQAEALSAAARTRLAYWDISPAQTEQLIRTGKVVRTLQVTSPSSGLVMKRMPGLEGMAVRPGMELFHIADLSSLWLSVEVFENQLALLQEGSPAEINLDYFPGETFTGKVRYVEPQVSEKTRTVSLKVEVPNRDGKLRAGMYATVTFEPATGENVLAVPTLSVLRTGQRNLVILAEGGGRFTPREVVLGPEGDEYVEVRSGLKEGDVVVTSSQFLLDSESNLREAIQKLIASKKGGGNAQ